MDVPMSRSTEETSEVAQIIPQKCVSKRIGDDEKFVLIQNVDDERDEIGEKKKKKFSTSKAMGMHLACGWKEHAIICLRVDFEETLAAVTVSKRLTDFSVLWALRRSDIQHSRRKT